MIQVGKMGSINKINCDNCFFLVNTADNLTMIVCDDNLDYYNELYCLKCQKVVRVWQRKNGKDMENKCPECGSNDLILSLPYENNVKCPSCKKGNQRSELWAMTD